MRKNRVSKPSVNDISFTGQKTMNIYTRKGEKVIYSNFENGLESDKAVAKSLLELSRTYTVKKVSRYSSYSKVYFVEIDYEPGFNTILFQNVELDERID